MASNYFRKSRSGVLRNVCKFLHRRCFCGIYSIEVASDFRRDILIDEKEAIESIAIIFSSETRRQYWQPASHLHKHMENVYVFQINASVPIICALFFCILRRRRFVPCYANCVTIRVLPERWCVKIQTGNSEE